MFYRTVVEDTLYEAMYELYSKIVPSGCYVSVNRSEVQVKLKKEEPGTWPRLLKEKTKVRVHVLTFCLLYEPMYAFLNQNVI